MKNIYFYKMTWDTEFAPNPHGGVLTLATCKPTIRRCAQIGDWISGWTAKEVHDKNHEVLVFPDRAKLIYLARITDIIPIAQYWHDYEFKRPKKLEAVSEKSVKSGCGGHKVIQQTSFKYDFGDNIYKPICSNPNCPADYEQVANRDHIPEDKEHDLSGKNVLICEEFYYFGVHHALEIPEDVVNFAIPRCKKQPIVSSPLIQFIQDRYPIGIQNPKP